VFGSIETLCPKSETNFCFTAYTVGFEKEKLFPKAACKQINPKRFSTAF